MKLLHLIRKESTVNFRTLLILTLVSGLAQGVLLSIINNAAAAAAFEKLIHDEPLRKQFGEAGREFAQRNCWKQSAEALFRAESSG